MLADEAVDQARKAQRIKLEEEVEQLRDRLAFVDTLVGPIEAQRKSHHGQVLAARAAVLNARHHLGAPIPTRWAGRLDERMLRTHGLSERDIGVLQGGCLPNTQGVLQDVSLLGDPSFKPYDSTTGAPKWDARGGALKMSLQDVRDRFGEEVALAVVRIARELDQHDSSRRIGIELPWHPVEDRELSPAEVIEFLGAEVVASGSGCDCDSEIGVTTDMLCMSEVATPRTTVASAKASDPPRRGGAGWSASDAAIGEEDGDYPWSLSDEDVCALFEFEKPPLEKAMSSEAEDAEVDMEIRRLLDLAADEPICLMSPDLGATGSASSASTDRPG